MHFLKTAQCKYSFADIEACVEYKQSKLLPWLRTHEYKCDPEDLRVGSLGCIYQLKHLENKKH